MFPQNSVAVIMNGTNCISSFYDGGVDELDVKKFGGYKLFVIFFLKIVSGGIQKGWLQ